LTITLIALAFAEPDFCQQVTLFLKTPKRFNPVDSFDYRSKIQYFSAMPANREKYILSVDQSKIEFLYGVPYISAKYNYLKVPVTLINASETTLSYFRMSGSWWDIYKTDNQIAKVFAQSSCYKNSIITLSLAPHQHIEKDIVIEVPKEVNMAFDFRIGITLKKNMSSVYSINGKPTQLFLLTPGNESIIWSNYVMISQWSAGKKRNKYNLGL
jgi:hypothetical protein